MEKIKDNLSLSYFTIEGIIKQNRQSHRHIDSCTAEEKYKVILILRIMRIDDISLL